MDKLKLATEMARVEGEIRFTAMKIERSIRIGSAKSVIARHQAALASYESELATLRAVWGENGTEN